MFLERQDLLDALDDRLRRADDGDGSIALVSGEAGAGKTALVGAFVRSLGDRAVIGACDPLSTPRPLGPLRDFLDIEDLDNVDLFRAILHRFGRADSARVVVLEDLHWADQATLDFLRYIGRRVVDTRLLVVCTFRDDEIGPDHPLRTVLGQLARSSSTVRLDVPMLTLDAVRRLAHATALDPIRLHTSTGGNAFYVTEIIAAGSSASASVSDAVLARLGRLPEPARRVAETVSVSPRSISIEIMRQLGSTADDIDASIAGGVVLGEHDRLRFRHELARSIVENAIPPARRRELHRAVLELLLAGDASDVARIAHHAIAADAHDLVIELAPIAAREARRRGATREAANLLRATLERSARLAPDDQARLRLDLGGELVHLDHPAEALAHLDAAASRFGETGADLDRADALRHAGRAHGNLGRPDEALRCAERAVDLAERHGPSETLVLALGSVAGYRMLARQVDAGLPLAARAIEMARVLKLDEARRSVEQMHACLELVGGDPDRGIEMLRRWVDESADVSPAARLMGLVNLGSGAGEVRRYDVALDALTEAEEFGVDIDNDAMVAYSRAWLARVAFEQGRWDDAGAYAELVEATATNRVGYSLLTARGVLGRLRVRRGDPGGAELLEDTLREFRGHDLQYRWSPTAGLAEHHWMEGDRAAMIGVLAEPFAEALGTQSEWARGELGYWMCQAGAIDSSPEICAAPYAAQIDGDVDEAVRLWESIGCPYEVALTRSEGTVEAATESLETLDGLGAAPLADLVRSDLRSRGLDRIPRGPSPTTRAHPFGLTARQAEVLDLIVEGLTNAEIADRIFVSKKTVEHHVSAVYAKLGVETRGQAIASVHRSGR